MALRCREDEACLIFYSARKLFFYNKKTYICSDHSLWKDCRWQTPGYVWDQLLNSMNSISDDVASTWMGENYCLSNQIGVFIRITRCFCWYPDQTWCHMLTRLFHMLPLVYGTKIILDCQTLHDLKSQLKTYLFKTVYLKAIGSQDLYEFLMCSVPMIIVEKVLYKYVIIIIIIFRSFPSYQFLVCQIEYPLGGQCSCILPVMVLLLW